jgi:hypothetical protein
MWAVLSPDADDTLKTAHDSVQEAIEQCATKFGVPVDARVQRGRTNRHVLRQAIEQERFDRVVIAAAAKGTRDCRRRRPRGC